MDWADEGSAKRTLEILVEYEYRASESDYMYAVIAVNRVFPGICIQIGWGTGGWGRKGMPSGDNAFENACCCRSAKTGPTFIFGCVQRLTSASWCLLWVLEYDFTIVMTREVESSVAMNTSTHPPELRAVVFHRPPSTECTSPG